MMIYVLWSTNLDLMNCAASVTTQRRTFTHWGFLENRFAKYERTDRLTHVHSCIFMNVFLMLFVT